MHTRGDTFDTLGVNDALSAESRSPASGAPDTLNLETVSAAAQDDVAKSGPAVAPLPPIALAAGPATPSADTAADTPPDAPRVATATPDAPEASVGRVTTPETSPERHEPVMAFAPLTALALGTGRATMAERAAASANDAPTVTAASPTSDAAKSSGSAWSWVPIRSLGARHRERILAHLLALEERARYLRFGFPATDAQLAQYVDRIDFDRDEVFGIFNRRLQLIALAHLAHPSAPGANGRPAMSEFGVSVLARARRRGFGQRLFEHATLHARNRGVRAIFIHALSENTAMLKIASDAGATVHREGSETDAWLELPPDTFASHLDELVGTHAAELDYRLKTHVQQVSQLLGRETGGSDGQDAEASSGVE